MSAGNVIFKNLIREVPDFPQKGISFKDITTLLHDGPGLKAALMGMLEPFGKETIDYVIGVESRGFIFGTPMAVELGCGFVPVRKPGKLPCETLQQDYALEYGSDSLEIHKDAIQPGQSVLMVDDLLATGGTMEAACQLVESLHGRIVGISFLVELSFLKGRQRLAGYRLESLIQY